MRLLYTSDWHRGITPFDKLKRTGIEEFFSFLLGIINEYNVVDTTIGSVDISERMLSEALKSGSILKSPVHIAKEGNYMTQWRCLRENQKSISDFIDSGRMIRRMLLEGDVPLKLLTPAVGYIR